MMIQAQKNIMTFDTPRTAQRQTDWQRESFTRMGCCSDRNAVHDVALVRPPEPTHDCGGAFPFDDVSMCASLSALIYFSAEPDRVWRECVAALEVGHTSYDLMI